MSYKFYPHEEAEKYLIEMGINFEAVYNDDGGIKRAQLTILTQLSNNLGVFLNPNTGEKTTIKQSAYKTIDRLYKSENRKNISFDKNLFNTLVGTVGTALVDTIDQSTTGKQKKETMIKWLPSSAHEQDEFHALQYGKVMTMQRALDLGLGTRYGCQCGMEILNDEKGQEVDKLLTSTTN